MTSSPRIDKRQSLEKMLLALVRAGFSPQVWSLGNTSRCQWAAMLYFDDVVYEIAITPSAALRKAIRAWEQDQKK